MTNPTIFLLSPARLDGARGRRLLEGGGPDDLAAALAGEGAALADVFAHISSLYFRGKRAYARRFATPPVGVNGGWIVTSDRGLVPTDTLVDLDDLKEMAEGDIDRERDAYAGPLRATARDLRTALEDANGSRTESGDDLPTGPADVTPSGPAVERRSYRVVLLGSLASNRYVEPLLDVFRARLEAPTTFVGRGDMSRGGLMLRCVRAGEELEYRPVRELPRRGKRPPRLG